MLACETAAPQTKTAAGVFVPAPPHAERTRVIVVSSQKGGSGKTTLCGQLAVQAELAGAGPVAIVDTDPQGSLAAWWNARESETPAFMKTSIEYLEDSLDLLTRSGVRFVFVDTPPAVTKMIEEIVGYADLVLVPTRPSPHDLRAVGTTIDIVAAQRKPIVFAINDATPRARITSDAAIALSQHGTVAPVTIHHRVDFATSMIDGRTVMETNPTSRSANEIADLWSYLEGRLNTEHPRATTTAGLLGQSRTAGFGKRQPGGAAACEG